MGALKPHRRAQKIICPPLPAGAVFFQARHQIGIQTHHTRSHEPGGEAILKPILNLTRSVLLVFSLKLGANVP